MSPNNLPLRQALADALMGTGRYDEAEAEYKAALGLSPDNAKVKVALATAFYQQGKNGPALVIVEDLLKGPDPLPRALVLHAKLLVRADDVERAVRQYKRAVEADAAVADEAFAASLGIGAEPTDEASDGRLRAAREDDGGGPPGTVERPKITFADVGGMEAVKDDVRMKVIHPLQHAELYAAYGKPIGGGILMYGPPGCGKTHLARATAGEISAGFISGRHQRRARHVDRPERAKFATRCSTRPAAAGRACCSSTRSTPWRPAGRTCGPAPAGT